MKDFGRWTRQSNLSIMHLHCSITTATPYLEISRSRDAGGRFVCEITAVLRGSFGTCRYVDLHAAAGGVFHRMPWCHRILLENALRHPDGAVAASARDALLAWPETGHSEAEIPFAPARILMHDTTCGPALVDIAAMRDAITEAGKRSVAAQSGRADRDIDGSFCRGRRVGDPERPCSTTWRESWSGTPSGTAS